MRRTLAYIVALLACVGLTACGGDSTPAAPTPTSTTVTSTNTNVLLGATEQMTATVRLSNGTNQPTSAGTWGSDNPAVASVSSTGLVTSNGVGDATIFFDATGDGRGTKRLTVIPNFGGSWNGTYRIDNCTQSGAFQAAAFCVGLVGQTPPFTLNFTQTGTTVSGSWLLGSAVFNQTSATISGNGVTISSNLTNPQGIAIAVTWKLAQSSPNTITGSHTQTWTSPGLAGNAVISSTIATVAKTATLGEMLMPVGETPSRLPDLMRAFGLSR